MKWTETKPSRPPVDPEEVADLLELGDDFSHKKLGLLIAAATAYAETAMGRSLMQRTVTATFYANLCPPDELYLPRGPILSVTSVTPAGGAALDPGAYALEYVGNATARLRINGAHCYPKNLTVVYEAGYATGAAPNYGANVPDDIRQAVRMHAAYLFQNREGDGSPPEHLDRFYQQRTWEMGVG